MRLMVAVILVFLSVPAMAQTETMTATIKTLSSVTIKDDGSCFYGDGTPCDPDLIVTSDMVKDEPEKEEK